MTRAWLVAAAVLLTAGIGEAHHSYADFLDQTRSIGGILQTVKFANPHTVLTIRLSDGTVYKAVWAAGRQLDRQGVRRTALQVGDNLLITGYPHKDPGRRELSKLREVRRMADGWTWRLVNGQVTITETTS